MIHQGRDKILTRRLVAYLFLDEAHTRAGHSPGRVDDPWGRYRRRRRRRLPICPRQTDGRTIPCGFSVRVPSVQCACTADDRVHVRIHTRVKRRSHSWPLHNDNYTKKKEAWLLKNDLFHGRRKRKTNLSPSTENLTASTYRLV